ncbi:hypothetical protein [Mesorhizobium sp. Cs1299R1N3]|uniref:hypothetical protein n=1 Tax=Mesorhizobium sp. Cs1299R1N3 TaxID=3015173 RepID=UPI00301DE4C6
MLDFKRDVRLKVPMPGQTSRKPGHAHPISYLWQEALRQISGRNGHCSQGYCRLEKTRSVLLGISPLANACRQQVRSTRLPEIGLSSAAHILFK